MTSNSTDSGGATTSRPFSGRMALFFVFVALSLVLLGGGFVWWSRAPAPPAFTAERYLLPQAPIREVPARPVAGFEDRLAPTELVLGVTVGPESRAYPLRLLGADPQRKVLNDRLAGHSIAATW